MTSKERRTKKIMKVEGCDRVKAERFYELSEMLTSDDFTPELGRQIYDELVELRK